MRIAILAACLGKNDAGPETYEKSLIEALAEIDLENEYHIFCFNKTAADCLNISNKNFKIRILWPKNRVFSLLLSLPLVLQVSKCDLLHSMFVAPPKVPVPSLLTIHDLSPITYPEFYPKTIIRRLAPLLKNGLKKADHLISISEYTRETINELFDVNDENITTVHHGIDKRFCPLSPLTVKSELKAKLSISFPYILFLGKLETRKNITGVISAFAKFKQRQKSNIKLVLVGRRHHGVSDLDEMIRHLHIDRDVLEIGYVDSKLLPALYNGAEFFVFPSLLEGFGFPILEAMACGTPVITSNISCMPEVAGGAAFLVDPLNHDSITDAMVKLSEDRGHYENLKKRGLERAAQFSWSKTAKRTLKVYQQIYSKA